MGNKTKCDFYDMELRYLFDCYIYQLFLHFLLQIPFKTRYELGSPGEAICHVAKEEQVTCILLGNRGLGAFRRRILGSVSDHVVHHSKVPVIIVPPKEH